MSSSPPDKQPAEVSDNPESSDVPTSDIRPEPLDDDTDLTTKTQSEIASTTKSDSTPSPSQTQPKSQETKSSRRNPLTWWRNKTGDTHSNQQPNADSVRVLKIASPEQSASSPEKSTSSPKTILPTPMTEIKLFAPLDTVGTENYLRYGLEGPRHYVMGIIESVPTPEDITIQIEIVAPDSTAKFNADDIQLKRLAHEPQNRTVWGIHNPTLHTHIIWIWDFFRMLSSIQLTVETPQSSSENEIWTKLATTLQTLVPNDQLIIRVHNNIGTITQIHQVKS